MALSAIIAVIKRTANMWVGKTKIFAKWADKEGLTDAVLRKAITEISVGSVIAFRNTASVNPT